MARLCRQTKTGRHPLRTLPAARDRPPGSAEKTKPRSRGFVMEHGAFLSARPLYWSKGSHFSVTSFTLHQLPLAVVQVMRSLVVVTVLHVAALVTPPVYDPSFTHADPLHRSTVYVRG